MSIEGGYQSTVSVGTFREQKCVVKRVLHPRIPGVRRLEKWLLDREARALKELRDVPEVPRFLGRPDSYGIAIEYRAGETLRDHDPNRLPPSYFHALESVVKSIHRKGIVHSDLKKKENLMVSPEGRPVLIDFGTHFRVKSPVRFVNNFLYEQFRQIDRNAVAKLKSRYCPETLTEAEREDLDNPVFLERVSRFGNRYVLFRAEGG